MDSDWKQRAEALFFDEGKNITEISALIGVSVRSISKYFNSPAVFSRYEIEIKHRKLMNRNRTDYFREWKRKNRISGRYHAVTEETMRQEHVTAVKILSRERHFK